MRIGQITRKLPFFIASGIFLIVCYLLYNSLDAANARKKDEYEREQAAFGVLQEKLHNLEKELKYNDKVVSDIKGGIMEALGGGKALNENEKLLDTVLGHAKKDGMNIGRKTSELSASTCQFSSRQTAASDVQMLSVYDAIAFDNPDGGAWKQGWSITYDKKQLEAAPSPLQVFLVPHSHCDPGWIKTFDQYYSEQTKKILDNMVSFLSAHEEMKFIYAEMSFFEKWWRDIDVQQRELVKRLLQRGQLEIVTGGWVMTDEANSHFYSMAEQLIEGNQWLWTQFGYKPQNHWSIDPFGLSPTMAYILSQANFSTMTIQRVHYSVKKFLAKEKKLEFKWRQIWSDTNANDMQTHLFPFYSYDVPHTCGPEPAVCCQFDFKRLPNGGLSCPWNIPPVSITQSNVEQRASILLDQYRKKSELYATNVLLIPLGDDFRYDTVFEWNSQFENYQKLFSYMNSRKDWNVQASFGTLSDYFNALSKNSRPEQFPVLSGDFFTYADRDDHYWSGYYTSRPFHKRLDRILIHYLRGAEILYSLAKSLAIKENIVAFPYKNMFNKIVSARRNLGLFQHHDGITGTAKDAVVVDYANRMLESIEYSKLIISHSAQLIITKDKANLLVQDDAIAFDIDDHRNAADTIPDKFVINVASRPRSIIIYNSLSVERSELMCIQLSSPSVKISDSLGSNVPVQINPVLFSVLDSLTISDTIFEACFEARVPALGMSTYSLVTSAPQLPRAEGKLLSGPSPLGDRGRGGTALPYLVYGKAS